MFASDNPERFNFHMVVKDHHTKKFRILNMGSGVVLNPEYDSAEDAEADFARWDISGFTNILLDHAELMGTLVRNEREKRRLAAMDAFWRRRGKTT